MAKAENDHNVYILGAGFAAEAGLPVVKDFMNRMRDAHAWLETEGRDAEKAAIERVLQFRLEAAAAAYRIPFDVENIEELFSLASASGDEKLDTSIRLAIAATLDYSERAGPLLPADQRIHIGVNRRGWSKPPRWEEAAIHYIRSQVEQSRLKGDWYSCPSLCEFYCAVMASYFHEPRPNVRDTIVTFNYDLTIEEALRDLGLRPDYGTPSENTALTDSARWMENTNLRPVALLKLHGSVNWHGYSMETGEGTARLSQAGITGYPKTDEELLKLLLQTEAAVRASIYSLEVFGDYGSLRKSAVPFLTPPTWRKNFAGHLTHVWKGAVDALRTATRVVILGYSIPITDHHFKYLLAAGLRDNISLRKILFVNPALKDELQREELKRRLLRLVRPELVGNVVEMMPLSAREFFGNSGQGGERSCRWRIGRPVASGEAFDIYGTSAPAPPFAVCDPSSSHSFSWD